MRATYPDNAPKMGLWVLAVLADCGVAWAGYSQPQATPVWRALEGPEGTGGLRGAEPNAVRSPSLAGGRAIRCPEQQWAMNGPTGCRVESKQ